MAITNIKKRVAYFYDDKGEFIGKKAFSKTADTFEYAQGTYNVFHDDASFTLIKRWYWDIQSFHYNINNPDPFKFGRTVKPVISPEVYSVHMNTNMLKKLNELNKTGLQFDLKTVVIGLGILALGYYLLSGNKLA